MTKCVRLQNHSLLIERYCLLNVRHLLLAFQRFAVNIQPCHRTAARFSNRLRVLRRKSVVRVGTSGHSGCLQSMLTIDLFVRGERETP